MILDEKNAAIKDCERNLEDVKELVSLCCQVSQDIWCIYDDL